jgi:predicted unusual protein kinase regulating ubiquinone biosynthesis (AarF/ABC1/UbiB family)
MYEFLCYLLFRNKILLYKNLIKRLTKLNIIFIKIIQWITVDNGDIELNNIVKNITNNVEYSNEDIDHPLITDIENYSNNELVIDRIPINSGTIALVYKGKLNNKDVVIKMKRKNIKQKLNDVVHFLNNIVYIIEHIPFINIENYSIKDILKYNMHNFVKQSDFHLEATNIQKFYNNYINESNIIIPKVYIKYTNRFDDVIVMEYLDGKHLTEIDNNYYDYILKILHFLNTSLYNHNIIHSDIHPGNILFMDDKIGIIDFGFVSLINRETGFDIYSFYNYYTSGKRKKLYKLIVEKICIKINNNIIISQDIINNEYNNFLIFFQDGGPLSHNKHINYNDLKTINIFFSKINLIISEEFINIILSISPMISLINFLLNNDSKKTTDTQYYIKDAFNLLKKTNIPDELINY